MINVGVIGCSNLLAAELVRILINHPDVELRWVRDDAHPGERLDSLVPGIIGESDLIVTSGESLDGIDLVYLCGNHTSVSAWLSTHCIPDGLHVIDLSGSHNLDHGIDKPWTYGLGEMQRRVLVHNARLVTVPGSAAAASLLAVLPLARNSLIGNPLTFHVAAGTSAFAADGKTLDGLTLKSWTDDQRQEVELALRLCQSSFGQPVEFTVTPLAEQRTLAVAVRMKCNIDGEQIRQLYEQYYDDHNFVYMVDRPVVTADVENTGKCLIRLDKDEHSGLLTVHAVMDMLLKGGAATAVHAMNLMFGLHERAGLALKGTGCLQQSGH